MYLMLIVFTCRTTIMANTYTNSFIHNIGLNEENSLSHLLDKISPEIENETALLEHLSAWPEVRGTADTDGGAYSPFRSILLVLTHDFIIIQLYGPACGDG